METSKTYQYRKVMKPLLERKRRARINKCLDNLKDLMVECLTHEGEHIVRLEKADILELTVDYLNKIKQRKEMTARNSVRDSFRSGYVHAVNEVSKILASTRGVDVRLGTTLMTHLGYRLNQIGDELRGSLAPRTSTPIQQKIMSPLKIDLDSDVSGDCPLSPASSGYHSQLCSPVASEGSFSMMSECRPSTAGVWRPW